jgi:iron complex transport system permease protein
VPGWSASGSPVSGESGRPGESTTADEDRHSATSAVADPDGRRRVFGPSAPNSGTSPAASIGTAAASSTTDVGTATNAAASFDTPTDVAASSDTSTGAPASGATAKPVASGVTTKPAASGTTAKPAASGATANAAISSDTSGPVAASGTSADLSIGAGATASAADADLFAGTGTGATASGTSADLFIGTGTGTTASGTGATASAASADLSSDTGTASSATTSSATVAHPGPTRRRLMPILLGLLAALLVSAVVAVGIGTVAVPITHTWAFLRAGLVGGVIGPGDVGQYRIIWDIRLPRVLLAVVVGAGLATVGVAIQAMVRNALAEPFVLGISSGASVGATAVALFGVFASMGVYALSVGAFLAALGATVIVYLVARTREGLTPLRLVLTGTAMSYGFFAVTTVLVFQAPNGEAARSALFWLLGSLAGANWASLPVAAIVVVAGALLLFALSGRLNALAMGDEAATTLGVSVPRLRVLLFVVCSAMTGVLVAVSGAIGFVGLILPHLVRLVVGADHRRVLAVAPLAGAVFLVWVDVAARVLAAPEELPIGVLTAAVGVPAFLVLMRRRAYVFGGA